MTLMGVSKAGIGACQVILAEVEVVRSVPILFGAVGTIRRYESR